MRAVFSPESVEEALVLRTAHPHSIWMAGGTDVLVQLRHPKCLEDDRPLILLERLPSLARIDVHKDDIRIGSCVSFGRIASDPLLTTEIPVLTQAAATVGGPALRNMATIGGNVCTASPAGDSLPALYVLDASVELVSASGTRRLAISEFLSGPRKTELHQDELLASIVIPRRNPPWTLQKYEKIGKRKALAIAVASMAAVLRINPACGIVEEAHLAWGSLGPTVMRCPPAEEALIGRPLTEEALCAAAEFVPKWVHPIDDIRASAEYRRAVGARLMMRLLDP